jgi:hypothetical protein
MPKKPSAKPKPMAPRFPTSTSVKKPMPKIIGAKPSVKKPMASPTKKPGVVVALPNGSTVGLKDIGKVKPTPKPKPKVTPKAIPTKSDSQYFNDQKKFIESRKKLNKK